MAQFDAELYLRVRGERTLLASRETNRGWRGSGLGAAAGALRAVGLISADAAQAVVDDYGFARSLRHEGYMHHRTMRAALAPAQAPPALQPRRVVPCDVVLEQQAGTMHIRSVSLGDHSTRLAITFRAHAPSKGRARGGRMAMFGGGPFGGGTPHVTLADDRGTTAGTHFGGTGSDSEWEGHLQADRPLARDTKWIEVDGQRLELVDDALPVEVSVEELRGDGDPGLRHLWHRAASRHPFHQHGDALEAAIDALVASAALAADDPELEHVRAVAAALQPHGPTGSGRRLPEPWRSLFARRGRSDGPAGTIVVGAVTPPFDGISVAVTSIQSESDAFDVEVEIAPGIVGGSPFDETIDEPLVWWAADDCGNHYLGGLNGWSGSDTHSDGRLEFWPALDPKATRLDLMPTTERTRCVIRVPLRWGES